MFNYTDSGLDNVWLVNGYTEHKTAYGDGVSIDDLPGLHMAIASSLTSKPGDLTGAEFLFLRKELNMSQQALAEVFGVKEGTIRNLERKECVTAVYSILMKLMAKEYFLGESRIYEVIESAKNKHDTCEKIELSFAEDDRGWHYEQKVA